MAEQYNSSRLSRPDVVAIVVACLLLILLVPVLLAKPREQAVRAVCAANLAQIGKAMFIYAGDNEGVLPRAGGPSTVWGATSNWTASDHRTAFGLAPDNKGGSASISSCFYLLVKYLQVPPRVFVCKDDEGTVEFRPARRADGSPAFEFADVWDFGPPGEAMKHCSYTYHIPYVGPYALTTSRDPNLAVAADRSPWITSPAAAPTTWATFIPDISPYAEHAKGGPCVQCALRGNSITHGRDGQNVLFLDGRVKFEKRAYCAVDKDNIYTVSTDVTGRGHVWGVPPTLGPTCIPANNADSVLVHDPPAFPPLKPPSSR
jgi:hypothetical protein